MNPSLDTCLAPFAPIVELLPSHVDVEYAMRRLAGLPFLAILDSAMPMGRLGHYSFLVADPFDLYQLTRPVADPLAPLARLVEMFRIESPIAGLPPFQGGAVGFLGYEFGRCFERIPAARHNEFEIPLAMFGFYDTVLAWDHTRPGHGWIISQGFPETDGPLRKKRAEQRIRFFQKQLAASVPRIASASIGYEAMAHGLTAPQFQTRLGGGWLGNFDSIGFRAAVDRAREFIYAGDIFQVNLSQRLMRPSDIASLELFCRLRSVNPAPFAAYFDGGPFQIVSASPERFLQVHDKVVESRPIKGTRRRTGDLKLDAEQNRQLQESQKDLAENTMIVDLIRNDLSRVCEPESLTVPEWYSIEEYPFVTHAVSSIEATLRSSTSVTDLIRATFPGGSITGAPKVRAMEIIAELEPTVRGPYCGSMGYIGFDGSIDLNILIRTITASRGWWQFQVGGGIVADSDSEAEEEETWIKAAGLVKAIQGGTGPSGGK